MNISIEELSSLLGNDRFLRDHFARARAGYRGTYSDFVDRLYLDIDRAIHGLQGSRELLQGDIEDRITLDLLLPLRQLGYTADHDTKTGGHVDLSVAYGQYTWIGEAKRDGNFQEGFLQLMTRYVPKSGDYSHNAGGLLFYFVKTKDAKGKMQEWMKEIAAEAISCAECQKNPLAFFSEHKLEGPGTSFHVRSMAVALYHSPQDASARATRARHAAKQAAADETTAKRVAPNKRGRRGLDKKTLRKDDAE